MMFVFCYISLIYYNLQNAFLLVNLQIKMHSWIRSRVLGGGGGPLKSGGSKGGNENAKGNFE